MKSNKEKSERLLDLLAEAPADIVRLADETDSAYKLGKLRKRTRMPVRRIAVIAACLSLIVCAALIVPGLTSSPVSVPDLSVTAESPSDVPGESPDVSDNAPISQETSGSESESAGNAYYVEISEEDGRTVFSVKEKESGEKLGYELSGVMSLLGKGTNRYLISGNGVFVITDGSRNVIKILSGKSVVLCNRSPFCFCVLSDDGIIVCNTDGEQVNSAVFESVAAFEADDVLASGFIGKIGDAVYHIGADGSSNEINTERTVISKTGEYEVVRRFTFDGDEYSYRYGVMRGESFVIGFDCYEAPQIRSGCIVLNGTVDPVYKRSAFVCDFDGNPVSRRYERIYASESHSFLIAIDGTDGRYCIVDEAGNELYDSPNELTFGDGDKTFYDDGAEITLP